MAGPEPGVTILWATPSAVTRKPAAIGTPNSWAWWAWSAPAPTTQAPIRVPVARALCQAVDLCGTQGHLQDPGPPERSPPFPNPPLPERNRQAEVPAWKLHILPTSGVDMKTNNGEGG